MRQFMDSPLAIPSLFAALALLLWLSGLGRPLFLLLNGPVGTALPGRFWESLTLFGDSLVALALLNLLAHLHPRLLPAGLLAALLATLVSQTAKAWFALDRPLAVLGGQVHVLGVALSSNSFPSGHTVTAFVLAGLCAQIWRDRHITAGLLVLASLVGLSRVMVGAHWPLDVLVGAALGWGAARLGWWLAGYWQWAYSKPGQRVLTALFLLFAALLFLLKTGYPDVWPLQMWLAGVALTGSLYQLGRARDA